MEQLEIDFQHEFDRIDCWSVVCDIIPTTVAQSFNDGSEWVHWSERAYEEPRQLPMLDEDCEVFLTHHRIFWETGGVSLVESPFKSVGRVMAIVKRDGEEEISRNIMTVSYDSQFVERVEPGWWEERIAGRDKMWLRERYEQIN